MRIEVHLYGTLPQRFPAYDPAWGVEIVLPDGARVGNLLSQLGIGEEDGCIVTCAGRVLAVDSLLADGVRVQVLQQVHGG